MPGRPESLARGQLQLSVLRRRAAGLSIPRFALSNSEAEDLETTLIASGAPATPGLKTG